MIPKILDRFENEIGLLPDCIKGRAIEERNGMCEAEITYPIFSLNWEELKRGNIIVADVNDTLKNQMFRIYRVSKPLSGKINVYARHIFFDIARDIVDGGLELENASCEYALNELFRNSQFSQKFKGFSNIINAQNYKIPTVNLIKAIGGHQGSILDTFGTGAELLRDNRNVHILNRRGHDNGVTIEYAKNITGLDIEYDDSNLITRIKAFAKYTDENNNEIIVESNPRYVDSAKINDYEMPFISKIDFSGEFKEGDKPTPDKLKTLAENYYRDTKCDEVKINIKLESVPLSKCLGCENIQDKISLCDIVTIKDYRYKLNTQAKTIKTYYDFLVERYEKMELGEPKVSLGDLVGGGQGGSNVGENTENKIPGINDSSFPNTLPNIPVLNSKLYGFDTIELSWTFEAKSYYTYELYASKVKDFEPNTFDLLFKGNASTFLHSAKPNETWYYKIRAVNTHGDATGFSNQVGVSTIKIDDLSNYVSEMAIGDTLIGTLNLGRGWFGELRGNYIDARQLSVTDGNGKRTLDIDSFGNVNLDVASFKIANNKVYTSEEADNAIGEAIKDVKTNILPNGSFNDSLNGWNKENIIISSPSFSNEKNWCNFYTSVSEGERYGENIFDISPDKVYNFSMLLAQYSSSKTFYRIKIQIRNKNSSIWEEVKEFTGNTTGTRSNPQQLNYTFRTGSSVEKCRVWIGKLSGEVFDIYIADLFMGTGTIYARKSEFQILDTKIASKVSENEFGTLVEQNAHAVKIAWNNISNYVQFENGGLSIYNGSVTTSQKRAVFDEDGNHFWRDGYYLGKIGTNQYASNSSIKGINFNLEALGGYMTWAVMKNTTDTSYTMMLTYANKTVGNYSAGKLHAGCDLDMHNYTLRNVNFEGGGITGTMNFVQITSMNSNGTAGNWYNNCKLQFQNGILINGTWG